MNNLTIGGAQSRICYEVYNAYYSFGFGYTFYVIKTSYEKMDTRDIEISLDEQTLTITLKYEST